MGALGFGLCGQRSPARRFDPARLFGGSGQGGWYDPADASTIWSDAAGTVPASVGSPVGRVADKSGRGNHLVQTVAAARPVLRADAEGRVFIEFDGVDDHLATAAATPVMAQPVTAVVAAAFGAGTSPYERVFDAAPGHSSRLMFGEQNTGTLAFAGAIAVTEPFGFPTATDVWALRYAGAGSQMRRRGLLRSSGNPGAGTLGGFMLGAGNYNGVSEFMSGRVHGLILVGRALTDTEVRGAERWMAARAGVRF